MGHKDREVGKEVESIKLAVLMGLAVNPEDFITQKLNQPCARTIRALGCR